MLNAAAVCKLIYMYDVRYDHAPTVFFCTGKHHIGLYMKKKFQIKLSINPSIFHKNSRGDLVHNSKILFLEKIIVFLALFSFLFEMIKNLVIGLKVATITVRLCKASSKRIH